jgi:hypothetical protein
MGIRRRSTFALSSWPSSACLPVRFMLSPVARESYAVCISDPRRAGDLLPTVVAVPHRRASRDSRSNWLGGPTMVLPEYILA